MLQFQDMSQFNSLDPFDSRVIADSLSAIQIVLFYQYLLHVPLPGTFFLSIRSCFHYAFLSFNFYLLLFRSVAIIYQVVYICQGLLQFSSFCLSIRICYFYFLFIRNCYFYFLSIKRCSYPYAFLLLLHVPGTFCLSGGAFYPYAYLLPLPITFCLSEVQLPLCLFITITWYFLSIMRCILPLYMPIYYYYLVLSVYQEVQ